MKCSICKSPIQGQPYLSKSISQHVEDFAYLENRAVGYFPSGQRIRAGSWNFCSPACVEDYEAGCPLP